MPSRKTVTAIVAVCIGGGAAVAIPAGIAVGQSSPPSATIIIRPTARIIDGGVVAEPSAYVVCPAGAYGGLSINLAERSGRSIASGYGYTTFTCNGQIETIGVTVVASTVPFVPGKAFAQAYSYADGSSASRTITLQRK